MSRCYDAVPCWIMPTWRVAEQLPPEIGTIDLVIIDEASQSDVTELPALLRGRKLLVVGDDRQVSPTPPFVTQAKLSQLRHHYLGGLPFNSLLEPGESIYDLMRAVFPDSKVMLKEHFRCVEPIIQFSMQFYPEKMLPLRIPKAEDRLDPPLIDIYLPHGVRDLRRKINRAEADTIVDEISKIVGGEGKVRSIGVISLIGSEQADFIRGKLSEAIGEELMQRHSILCGDSATFQGTERDIVFLSMVADPAHKTALTMLRYEQRFNVAVSRARDRVFLVRSVKREELNPQDMKARLIQHFDEPMPLESLGPSTELERCDSEFERDMLRFLTGKGYRARAQVGSIGYRIDIVVEGADGRRLAVECDGDRFHGADKWREDMRRQRVLERIGWRFWRCFASSFYRDRDSVLNDLADTLARLGIEPLREDAVQHAYQFTERRTIQPEKLIQLPEQALVEDAAEPPAKETETAYQKVAVGDRLNLIFANDKKRMSVHLTESVHDPDNGYVSVVSPLGKAILGSEEGDEVEFINGDGSLHLVLIESALRETRPPALV
jgi:transcription elongation GreA/GreB family factor/very-short-patch-repair endonuclease